MGCLEKKVLAFLGGWKYKLSKQRIKSNTHAEGIFYFISQKEAIFAGADTMLRRVLVTLDQKGVVLVSASHFAQRGEFGQL